MFRLGSGRFSIEWVEPEIRSSEPIPPAVSESVQPGLGATALSGTKDAHPRDAEDTKIDSPYTHFPPPSTV